jgi:disulfide bond formation protein DsbB
MSASSLRTAALLSALVAAGALGVAFLLENWDGLAPCALCLVERWPYRVAVVLGLVAAVVPARLARILLWLLVLTILADAAVAFVHVGVEAGWWPSPLPECAAPRFSTGSIAERLSSMPARPAKPCDDPSYLIPDVPVSLAMANLIFAAIFAAVLAWFLASRPISRRRLMR